MKRANFSLEAIQVLKKAFKILFFENHTLDKAKELVKSELPLTKELSYLLSFISSSKRGLGRQ
jgi:UDP-N-acetylglucosamine acyltransferase